MKIKELAKIYQDGGEWSDEMENLMNAHIVSNIGSFFNEFIESIDELDMSFENYVGLQMGLWQAKNGFHRSFDLTGDTK